MHGILEEFRGVRVPGGHVKNGIMAFVNGGSVPKWWKVCRATESPFGLANIGVHFEFLVLGSVKVKCSEVLLSYAGGGC